MLQHKCSICSESGKTTVGIYVHVSRVLGSAMAHLQIEVFDEIVHGKGWHGPYSILVKDLYGSYRKSYHSELFNVILTSIRSMTEKKKGTSISLRMSLFYIQGWVFCGHDWQIQLQYRHRQWRLPLPVKKKSINHLSKNSKKPKKKFD
jgi:hypothetical protein